MEGKTERENEKKGTVGGLQRKRERKDEKTEAKQTK